MRRSRRHHAEHESTFELNLTAMVDMFTVLLIFLISNFSMSSVQISAADKMKLPDSMSAGQPVEGLKMVVRADGIYIEDKQIVAMTGGKLNSADLDPSDPNFIKPLFEELEKQAEKVRSVASVNETVKFEGKVILQADQEMNYGLLKRVMYTSTLAGYADMKLATVSN